MNQLQSQQHQSIQSHPRELLTQLRQELCHTFLERERVIDGFLSALLSRQHILLLGPPGTAKSALAQTLCKAFDGAEYFSWLLTRFSTPEELFGPVSLSALQQDRFERKVEGKLPEAHIAFLDECFKANSAILNALLTLINERTFYNNGVPTTCPLVSVVGASNELPESEELEALFDRFALRFWIDYITDTSNMRTLLTSSTPSVTVQMTLSGLEQCQEEAAQIAIPDTTVDGILAIKSKLEEEGFRNSDRRWRQLLGVLKAYAYLEGDDEVTEEHFDLLPDMLWREPKDRSSISSIIASVGNPLSVKALEVLDSAKESVKDLGQYSGTDASAKADWLKSASLVDTQLQQMVNELEGMVNNHPASRTRKVKQTLSSVSQLRKDVMGRIAALYNL